MPRLLFALLPLLLAACASTPSNEVAMAPNDPGVICELETRTGSHMPTKRCRSAEQRDKDKSEAQAFGDAIRRSPAGGAGSQ